MIFLPYERVTITTCLDCHEAQERLAEVVQPRRWFGEFWSSDHKPYAGTVDSYQFKISKIIYYRNSFIPMIRGEILPTGEGCRIQVVLAPHWLTLIFMTFWLGSVGIEFIRSLSDLIISTFKLDTLPQGEPAAWLAFQGAFFSFGYLLWLGGFKFESIRTRAYFKDLFSVPEMEAKLVHENRFLRLTEIQFWALVFFVVVNSAIIFTFTKLFGWL